MSHGALVWSDEFAGSPGSLPNSAVWSYDDGPVYNHEMEQYVSDAAHCQIVHDPAASDGSALAITATDLGGGKYASARINTKGKYAAKYGYIEVRCKLPSGQGMWPAFWLLGVNDSWPLCGENDVMENIGKEPGTNHFSIHGPLSATQSATDYTAYNVTATAALPSGAPLSDAYHTYGLLWQPGKLTYYLDGKQYAAYTPASLPQGSVWTFDKESSYLILNLAVGGDWPGPPDAATHFPQTLSVDYIRVYAP